MSICDGRLVVLISIDTHDTPATIRSYLASSRHLCSQISLYNLALGEILWDFDSNFITHILVNKHNKVKYQQYNFLFSLSIALQKKFKQLQLFNRALNFHITLLHYRPNFLRIVWLIQFNTVVFRASDGHISFVVTLTRYVS